MFGNSFHDNRLSTEALIIQAACRQKHFIKGRSGLKVKAILQMGQALGLEVVAEGVETDAETLASRQLGGNIFKRCLFSPPIPKELFREKPASTRLILFAI